MVAGGRFASLLAALGPRPWLVGHRGAPREWPENSIPGFLRAVELGAAAIELDVRRTRDDRLVVTHDADLGRVAGRPDLVVEASDAATLRAVPLRGAAGGAAGVPPRIPELEEVLAALPPAVAVHVELKRDPDGPPVEVFARRALAAVAGRGRVVFSSFDWVLLATVARQGGPDTPCAPLVERAADTAAALGCVRALGAFALHASVRAAPAALAAAPAGLPVLVYTVNSPALFASLRGLGAAGVFSDDLPRLLTAPNACAIR